MPGQIVHSSNKNRLNDYSNEKHIISDSQAGFRKGFSTSDNIFIINSLIDILKSRHKKLFCVFVDFKQAFDTVCRNGLWHKLQEYNITGKCLSLIRNMYANIKSRIKIEKELPRFSNVVLELDKAKTCTHPSFRYF